jgi:hypothetical protein
MTIKQIIKEYVCDIALKAGATGKSFVMIWRKWRRRLRRLRRRVEIWENATPRKQNYQDVSKQ